MLEFVWNADLCLWKDFIKIILEKRKDVQVVDLNQKNLFGIVEKKLLQIKGELFMLDGIKCPKCNSESYQSILLSPTITEVICWDCGYSDLLDGSK